MFCEGKNDISFFREFLANFENEISYFDFNGENMTASRLKNQQTDKIRDLTGNPEYDLLIKAEGGKSAVRKIVPHFLPQLVEKLDQIVLVIDTDDKSHNPNHKQKLRDFNSKVKDSIEERYRGSGDSIEIGHDYIETEGFIANRNYLLDRKDEKSGEFIVIAWKGSLEHFAEVSEDYSDVEDKIAKLVSTKPDLIERMEKIIFG